MNAFLDKNVPVTDQNKDKHNDIKELADDFLDRWCEIEPLLAAEEGFSDYDDRIGDLSPVQQDRLLELAKSTNYLIDSCAINNPNDQLTADVLSDYCNDMIEVIESDDWIRSTNVISNPLEIIHTTCLNVDLKNPEAVEKRNKKIAEIPGALKTYKESIIYAAENDCLPRRTQLAHIAYNSALFGNDPIFVGTPARNAFLSFGSFLTEEILPKTVDIDAVGPEQYARGIKKHLGKQINLVETYQWGWNEIHSIFEEIGQIIKQLNPGSTYRDTIEMLENDESRTVGSSRELQAFLQNQLDESVSQLNGTHFDIDPRLLNIEACILEESGSSAMFYSPPSDDFSRPGRTYYPVNDKKLFPLWEEVTTCYHEGLPGHHLHIGFIKCLGDNLSRFQKTLAFNTGEGEGWALYAERLMVELGFNNDPAYIFGMLNASLFRATRVVMDIGLHCEFSIPQDAPEIFPRGEKWNKTMAIDILRTAIGMSPGYAKDEVYRYLGWIGQAPAYKIGEKTILDIRKDQQTKLGKDFVLKDFHTKLLSFGHVGLGRLEALFA